MSEPGDSTYAAFIQRRLDTQYAQRDRLDAKASALATASGGLVVLATGLNAVLLGKDYQFKTTQARLLLVVGLFLLIAATGFAMWANRLRRVVTQSDDQYRKMTECWWAADDESAALLRTTRDDRDTLIGLRRANNSKATWLQVALYTQLLGLAAVAGGTLWELLKAG